MTSSAEILPEEVKAVEPALEDQAAKTFSELIITWKRLRKALNLGAYHRVTTAILEFPLGDSYPKFQSDKELQAFKIGCTIIECKNFMISKVMEDKMKSAKMKQAAEVAETVVVNE